MGSSELVHVAVVRTLEHRTGKIISFLRIIESVVKNNERSGNIVFEFLSCSLDKSFGLSFGNTQHIRRILGSLGHLERLSKSVCKSLLHSRHAIGVIPESRCERRRDSERILSGENLSPQICGNKLSDIRA